MRDAVDPVIGWIWIDGCVVVITPWDEADWRGMIEGFGWDVRDVREDKWPPERKISVTL